MADPLDPLVVDALKKKLIAEYLSTPTGRSKLAMALHAPVKRALGYAALGRQWLPVQTLPDGCLPIYDGQQELPTVTETFEDWDDWVVPPEDE